MLQKLFIKLGSFTVLMSFYALGLAVLGQFYWYWLIIGCLLLVCLLGRQVVSIGRLFRHDSKRPKFTWKKEKGVAICLGIILIFSVFFGAVFTSENYYGGRDQGVYTNAAIMLARNGSFNVRSDWADRFHLHEDVQEPTYGFLTPGLKYIPDESGENGIFRTNFYLGYSAYLGIWYKFFGALGIRMANFLPLFLTLGSLFFVFKYFASFLKLSLRFSLKAFLILTLSSFLFIYFPKLTLSENFLQFCLWFSIYLLIRFYLELKKGKVNYWLLGLMFSTLIFGFLVRVEGLAYLAMMAIVVSVLLGRYWWQRKKSFDYKRFMPWFIGGGAVLGAIIIGVVLYVTKIQETYVINFSEYWRMFTSSKAGFEILTSVPLEMMSPNSIYHNMPEYIFKSLAAYNLFLPVLIAGVFVLYFIVQIARGWLSKKLSIPSPRDNYQLSIVLLFPLIIILPTINFLWNIFNSLDLPWSLRRYVPGILPLALLYTGLIFALVYKRSRKIAWIGLLMFFVLNSMVCVLFVTYRDNKGLLNEVDKIADLTEPGKSLVLIKAGVVPEGDSLISLPLFTMYDIHALHWHSEYTQVTLDNILLNKQEHDYENIFIVAPANEIEEAKKKFNYLDEWKEVYSASFSLSKLKYYPVDASMSVDDFSIYKPASPVEKQVELKVIKTSFERCGCN